MANTYDVTLNELLAMVENKSLEASFGNVELLIEKLHSSNSEGLESNRHDLELRRSTFGENFIEPRGARNFFYYFFKALYDMILIFLMIAAVIMIISGGILNPAHGWIEGVAIIIAVLIVSIVTATNDYTKEIQFIKLQKKIKLSNNVVVLRDGKNVEIPTKEIVVGDIVHLKYGDQIPADCIIVNSSSLTVDESSLTGECDFIKKNKSTNPYLFSGTNIMQGSAKVIVVAVGINSVSGKIMNLLGISKKKKTKKNKVKKVKEEELFALDPEANTEEQVYEKNTSILQKKLNKLALLIGKGGLVVGISITVILIVRFCIETYTGVNKKPFVVKHLVEILKFIVNGFTILIVAVPEGLPLAVTLSLAFSIYKMLKDNNLVRQLYSCETMGNATIICSDKTGTLTTNRMTVVQAYFSGKYFKTSLPEVSELGKAQIHILFTNISINKSPETMIKQSQIPGGLPTQLGNKTECSLLGFMYHYNMTPDQYHEIYKEDDILKIFPFNSEKKLMSTIIRLHENDYGYLGVPTARCLVKGAPEFLLAYCTNIISSVNEAEEMNVVELTFSKKTEIKKIIEEMASGSLRTIALAYKDIPISDLGDFEDLKDDVFLRNLIALGIVGIEDPVRPEVPKAIELCKGAGIRVLMVTGDNLITARSVSIKCGIYDPKEKNLVIDSTKFNRLIRNEQGKVDQRKFDKLWPRLRVLARSSPQDKYTLVNGIINSKRNKCREVVAVTGDGTNDAPALKRADVGFAMGISGTDVAKDASDIIITDDNFASIVQAVMWGRNVYDAISKFIQFQLTVNVVAILISVITSLIYGINALKALQLLWVNLIMDSLASLALATDEPTRDLLNRPPYGRNRSILTNKMFRFIMMHSIYQLAVLFIFVFAVPIWFVIPNGFELENHFSDEIPTSQHLTMIFNVFVLMQIFNEINARKVHGERNVLKNIYKNHIFLVIILVTFVLQVIIIQFSGIVFEVSSLDIEQWMWCLFFGTGELLVHQIIISLPNIKFNKILFWRNKKKEFEDKDDEIDFEAELEINAKLLWYRGLMRLRRHLRVINAFRDAMEPSINNVEEPILNENDEMQSQENTDKVQKGLPTRWSFDPLPSESSDNSK